MNVQPRWWATLGVAAIAACSDGGDGARGGDGVDGIKVQLESSVDDGATVWYLHVNYRYQRPVGTEDVQLQLRAACQIDAQRWVRIEPEFPTFRRGTRGARGWHDSTAFVLDELPTKPSLCELRISERRYDGTELPPLYEVCARLGQPPARGRCPLNPVGGEGTGAGLSVLSLEVAHHDADPNGGYLSGERLTLGYVVQAHRDQPPSTWVRVAIACADGATDEISHDEASELRAGEAFHAAQNKLHGRVPPATTPCTITFGSQPGLGNPESPIATFCYRDRTTTRGPCS